MTPPIKYVLQTPFLLNLADQMVIQKRNHMFAGKFNFSAFVICFYWLLLIFIEQQQLLQFLRETKIFQISKHEKDSFCCFIYRGASDTDRQQQTDKL